MTVPDRLVSDAAVEAFKAAHDQAVSDAHWNRGQEDPDVAGLRAALPHLVPGELLLDAAEAMPFIGNPLLHGAGYYRDLARRLREAAAGPG